MLRIFLFSFLMSEFVKGGSSEVEDRCGLMSFYSLCFPSSVSETTHTLSVACAHSSLLWHPISEYSCRNYYVGFSQKE